MILILKNVLISKNTFLHKNALHNYVSGSSSAWRIVDKKISTHSLGSKLAVTTPLSEKQDDYLQHLYSMVMDKRCGELILL